MEENNKIEELFKSSLENYEIPYDANAWTSLNKKLSQKPNNGQLIWWLAAAAIVLIISALAYFINQNTTSSDINLVSEKNNNKENSTNHLNKQEKSSKTENNVSSDTQNINNVKFENSSQNSESLIATNNDDSNNEAIKRQNESNNPVKTHDLPKDDAVIGSSPKLKDNPYTPQLSNVPAKCQGDKFELKNSIEHSLVLEFPSGKKQIANENQKLSTNLNEPGIYKVFYSDKNQSTLILEETSFTVNKSPTLDLQISDALDYENGLPVLHAESSTSESNVTWLLNGKDYKTTHDLKCDLTLYNRGRNTIETHVKNEFGCESTVSRIFNVQEDYNLLAVNSFSPNSNEPRRISFMPYALTIRNISFQLSILDPDNGGIVFSTDDATQSWDGIDRRTGNLIPNDKAYIWRVVIKTPEPGEKSVYKGTIVRF